MPELRELCVAGVDPTDPALLDEKLRELGLGRLRRSRPKRSEREGGSPEQTSAYASSLLPNGRRGYWMDLQADDPTFLGEVTDLLEEEGWEVVSCPSSTDRTMSGLSEAEDSLEALS